MSGFNSPYRVPYHSRFRSPYGGSLAASDPILALFASGGPAVSFRRLASGITNVVRVRRDNDDVEQDFSPEEITDGTLTSWVGAGNNGLIRTWYDQSGQDFHYQQPTASKQFLLVENGVLLTEAGFPATTSDGVNDSMISSGTNVVDAEFAIFIVVRAHTNDAFIGNSSSSSSVMAPVFAFFGSSLIFPNSTPLDRHLYFANRADPVSGLAGKDGEKTSGEIGSRTIRDPVLAANFTSSGEGDWMAATFQEVIYFMEDKTSEIDDINQNMADYWGVTLT